MVLILILYLLIGVIVSQGVALYVANDWPKDAGRMDWSDWMLIALISVVAGVFWPGIALGWAVTYRARKART